MGELEDLQRRIVAGERQLREIIGRVPDGILVLDANGVVLFANPAAEELMGLESGSLIGQEFGYPTVAGGTVEIDIARRGGSHSGETRQAETRQAEMRVVETEWEGEYAIVASLRDITERSKTDALRESEARYREVFENAFTANCITNPAGQILACNGAFLRMFGFSNAKEALGQNIGRLYAEPSEHADLARRLRTAESVEAGEIGMRRIDGRPVYGTRKAVASFSPEGELISISTYMLDLSERKSLEEQLRHAQKMEAVGRLAGGLAHGFNNLLTVVAGRASMMLDSLPLDSPLREDIEEIQGASDRAASITGRLLTFSRRQFSRVEDVSICHVLTGMERLIRSAVGDDIRVALHTDETAGTMRGDPSQLEQVILNLALNARDAMPDGGQLTIETHPAYLSGHKAECLGVAPGLYTALSVRDTGVGMTEEVKTHLFEPFFTTKEPGKGTGLGLSTIYGIVKHSGGAVAVESEPGQGALFRLYLPVVSEPADLRPRAVVAGGVAGGAETVLMVDDEPAVRKLTATILRRMGYRVIETSNPLHALRVASENRISALVTDVAMPEMSGRELADRVRQRLPALPVLYVSGFNEEALFQGGPLGPRTSFLAKPFTPDALGVHLRRVLDETGELAYARGA